jgi:hypothetical protein
MERSSQGRKDVDELEAPSDAAEVTADPVAEPRVRYCLECLNYIPAPRRKLCSARCAARRKLKLQTWRRARARER